MSKFGHIAALASAALLAVCLAATLGGCGGGGADSTSGESYSVPSKIEDATFHKDKATTQNDASIDTSAASQGYVAVQATNSSRLKFQVVYGEASYNYDLDNGGETLICPLNMGDGSYTFRVMQNTSGNSYVEIAAVEESVSLEDEFAPYLRPNMYANFSESSECVSIARELAADAQNEGDVVEAVYTYITENISYDSAKAAELTDVTGYVPDPDETLSSGTGICLDYACLAASMLRSLGIPCKIITGYVSPDGVYHAWNQVYIDGEWKGASISVSANTWTLIDTTFAAAGSSSTVGDGTNYTERYVY